MNKTVAIIGTLDTKGPEFAFLKAQVERLGCGTLVIDVGVVGQPFFPPDVRAEQVAAAAGVELSWLRSQGDRGAALDAMARGAVSVVTRLYEEGRFHGVISMGGGGGTGMAAGAMRALPIGVPKVMVSTMASAGDARTYVGTTDLLMFPSIVDVSGLNRISRTVFTNAAAAICGMVDAGDQVEDAIPGAFSDRPLIAATMFGNTTRAVDQARAIMEAAGYEVLVFHATGTGGKTMEMLIQQGYFAGVLDITTTEWADEICGGVLSAGPSRLEAAAAAGIPQVVVPGCVDMCNFWAPETVPARYKDRMFNHWNPNVTLMRTTPEENARMGAAFASRLNAARGPTAVYVPLRGFSELDAPGKPFWWPEADAAFLEALRKELRPGIPVQLLDHNVNDPEFARALSTCLLDLLKVEG
ncbi:MAG TPA: Tm-1-like ATP-binding domain-containing protein [Spirochaetia bacterium]|nr:Tm-1-like ATP-binding domain-containing protein [Spirochaetia bacterium]